jgi:thioredoxin reductase (NADPH)
MRERTISDRWQGYGGIGLSNKKIPFDFVVLQGKNRVKLGLKIIKINGQGFQIESLAMERAKINRGKHMTEIRSTVILGSGCAGLTAAIYTGRAGFSPLILEGHEPGGQLSMTTLVENFPGWPEGIQGPELIDNMKKQAARFGATFQQVDLASVDVKENPFRLKTSAGEILTRTLIVASGASARWLGLKSEQALIGHGVSSCATCDGFFFRGKEIAVVGGGDSAMEEALFLTRFASKVTLLHRREGFRASKIMLERAQAHPQIVLRPNTVIEEVLGVEEKDVKGLRLRDVTTGEQTTLAISGLFLGIGHEPNVKMFAGQIDLDDDGYIRTSGNVLVTNKGVVVPGIYACGDVQDRRYRQAITAAGSGCMAALEAEKFLDEQGH